MKKYIIILFAACLVACHKNPTSSYGHIETDADTCRFEVIYNDFHSKVIKDKETGSEIFIYTTYYGAAAVKLK